MLGFVRAFNSGVGSGRSSALALKGLTALHIPTRQARDAGISLPFSTSADAEEGSEGKSEPEKKWVRRKVVKYPDTFLQFLSYRKNSTKYPHHTATFRVAPKMTKHEIREALVKIYDLPRPFKVNTATFVEKGTRVSGRRRVVGWNGRKWKKAFVMWKPFW